MLVTYSRRSSFNIYLNPVNCC
uniref:Uncharacterized protein n=1 Tax=Lepeophtheirus salmonis TaxID=72036 RepID=A0A0K2UJ10_LEPSM